MAAHFPTVQTLGDTRFQFLSSVHLPETVYEVGSADPMRRDVYLLGVCVHFLLFGTFPHEDGDHLHVWNSDVDAEGTDCTPSSRGRFRLPKPIVSRMRTRSSPPSPKPQRVALTKNTSARGWKASDPSTGLNDNSREPIPMTNQSWNRIGSTLGSRTPVGPRRSLSFGRRPHGETRSARVREFSRF